MKVRVSLEFISLLAETVSPIPDEVQEDRRQRTKPNCQRHGNTSAVVHPWRILPTGPLSLSHGSHFAHGREALAPRAHLQHPRSDNY
eukprot:6176024-Pleurochrysis_carterae.AAC.2